MKNHVEVKIKFEVYDIEGKSPFEVGLYLEELAGDLIDPKFGHEYPYYDEGVELFIHGWRPMTERELEIAKTKREIEKASKERAKEKEKKWELEELERLAKKYNKEIK